MHNKSTLFVILAVAGLQPDYSFAADPVEAPIIVTATRTAETADETLAPVTIISRQTIEQNPGASVADLLRMQPGIEISRTGGPGQATSIFIRGANSNQTLVMIDGVKINSGTLGLAAVQDISPTIIDHIEIVKGPRSTQYGSEAVGGVINIITKHGQEGSRYNVSAMGGSDDTREYNLFANVGHEGKHASISASRYTTDGIPTRTSSDIRSGHTNTTLQLTGGMPIMGTDVQVSHWQSEGTTDYLDFLLNPVSQDYRNAVTSLRLVNTPTELWTSTF